MEPKKCTAALERNFAAFSALLTNLNQEIREFRESEEKWSIHEVCCHLLDEEQLDFRKRIEHIFSGNKGHFPPIDPASWVVAHDYAGRDFAETLDSFLDERMASVNWLNGLGNVNWKDAYSHPHFGEMTAEMFLHNWLAHDLLHIRQILRIQHAFLCDQAKHNNFSMLYAGEW